MGLLGKIFGSEKVISGGMDMLDNAFYTDQEKVENHKEMLKLYEPYKLAQRGIAFVMVGLFGLAFITVFAMSIIGLEYKEPLTVIDSFGIAYLTGLVFTFYFAGSVLGKGKK